MVGLRARLSVLLGVVTLVTMVTATPALAWGGGRTHTPTPTPSPSPRPSPPTGGVGVRLLEAPKKYHDNPRAYTYIIDHVRPGTTFKRKFEVSNTTDSPQQLSVFPGAAEIHNHQFIPSKEPNDLDRWITISEPKRPNEGQAEDQGEQQEESEHKDECGHQAKPDHHKPDYHRCSFVAPPHSRHALVATISVPKRATRGERLGVVWAQVSVKARTVGGEITAVNKVGIRVYLDVGPGGDPPSDFRIDKVVPGRTKEGQPVVRATVRNTGERVLDMGGQLWLKDGPSGLQAGPFEALQASTLARGDTAPVEVVLDKQIPEGPWKYTLELSSGTVKHSVSGTLTFPDKNGMWGLPASFGKPLPMALSVSGGLAAVALLFIAGTVTLRLRRRRAGPVPRA